MVQADYRGARSSNAGDDFHELWALRQALALLDQDTELVAVTVEGLRAEDENGTPLDTWDGVDCTFYFGGDHAASANRIVIAQLKYSAANPDQPWTVARLTHTSNKKKDNSVLGRLAKAFAGLKDKRLDLVGSGNVVVRLVSNQRVDPAVINALSDQSTAEQGSNGRSEHQSDRAALLTASGLQDEDFDTFATAFDLSECGHGSRFSIEESVLATIADWTDHDARAAVDHLMRFVRRAMLPEAKGESITRQSILLQLGFSDPRALFPCSPALKRIDRLIPREASRIVAGRMMSGDQRICLQGEGGCGKTTALQEIEALLPNGSVIIVFDCYGSGRYLDSDAYRHRPPDAFLQLSNDLARQLRIPLLVSRSADLDYPKVFKRRLERAAEVVTSRADDALLVIAVDAADNSITAASTRSPPERSFVHDFVALGDLPRNVRFIVTGRTGQLPALKLPHGFTLHEIRGFSRDESAVYVRGSWRDAPDAWIEDFHHLSGGNPRVEQYALEYAGTQPARALDYLRPNGKGLDQIFLDQLKYALRKQGRDQDIKAFCAGLIALPRPVPVPDLSVVTDLSEANIRDICSDLAPGVRLTNESIGFGDVEFEHFVRTEAEAQLGQIQTRIADHFVSRHRSSAYAATHVAAALLAANRGREIISLINEEREPTAIGDPVLRRETQLERLRIAMKVCRETGNNVDAMLTLLIGAEALKTDAAIRSILIENPDLDAYFAREPSSRMILRDPEEIGNHGPLLFHLMAADARDGNSVSVREGDRQIRAWLHRRDKHSEEEKRKHPDSEPRDWSIDAYDIAAQTEALLRIAGPQVAVDNVLRWSPQFLRLRVAAILSEKLITAGESILVERCVAEGGIRTPWDLFLLTPLALAGKTVDLGRLKSSLASLLRRRLIRLDVLSNSWREYDPTSDYLDTILTACEVVIARGGDTAPVIPVLERFAECPLRRRDKLFTSKISVIDLTLRSHALLERMAGRRPTLETYWVDPPEPPNDLSSEKVEQISKSDREKKEELQTFIGPLVEIYDVRAQALLGMMTPEEVIEKIKKKIASIDEREYRFTMKHDAQPMRTRLALSITRLMAIPIVNRMSLFECSSRVIGPYPDVYGEAEARVFASLGLEHSLHSQILSAVTARAKAVRNMKTSAEDKVGALIRSARLLVPISYKDAESLFNSAIEVAGELDVEVFHELALFAPLARRATPAMSADKKRQVARDLTIVIGDAAVRLAGYDHFPWADCARALASLDVCFALAATARWEDSSIVDRAYLLPAILKTALRSQALSPVQVSALSPLLDEFSIDMIGKIVDEAIGQKGNFDSKVLAEHLAQEELLRFGKGTRHQIYDTLKLLPIQDNPGTWMHRLACATTFHQLPRSSSNISVSEQQKTHPYEWETRERPDILAGIEWTAHHFVSASEIDEVIAYTFTAAKAADTYVSRSEIFDRMRGVVVLADRVAHLEALSSSKSSPAMDHDLVEAIAKAVAEWIDSPSVNQWRRERLIGVIVDRLPGFKYWIRDRNSLLPALFEKSGASEHQICAALIEGMERHVDSLDARGVYEFMGLVVRYCLPEEAAQVLVRYADQLLQRIPVMERDEWDVADIPSETAAGIARFLYALMGDVDVRTRWRAAHAIRHLSRLGDTSTIDRLVHLYDRTADSSYRQPNAPFYWLASRLWLVMTLNRIADETPLVVAPHGQWLLEIAANDQFPHILLRSFAKAAVATLVERKAFTISQHQKKALKRANSTPVPRRKAQEPYYNRGGFNRYDFKEQKDRRFHFDMMDTLPYWYTRAHRVFAEISAEEFLDTAERWIVDCWGVQGNVWYWDKEPRQRRLSDRSISTSHSHGSLPIFERFSTYLEWHAMWCTTGALMQTHALTKGEKDEYHTFEDWLKREGPTTPPIWLADVRGPKPLEDRLWFRPQNDIGVWLENVNDDDFLVELGLNRNDGLIIVDANHETRSRGFQLSARVHTALVAPSTAAALVRALQTIDDSWDYKIPTAGEEHEINAPPYKLVGWLLYDTHDLGIDERDPFRYGIRTIASHPSKKVESALNLRFVHDNRLGWLEARQRKLAFVYEAWGDDRDEHGERLLYDESVRSSGWRFLADKETLRNFLNRMRLDLMVEIEIVRRNKGYGYSRDDKEEEKETRFDRVVLLRRDGTIQAAEGCLGAWTAPRP